MKNLVAGVDEVGRGPLAGPVVTAAVILDPANMPVGLADSKTLSTRQREAIHDQIMLRALAVSFASASAASIDMINIRAATLDAMARAVRALALAPSLVLVDGRDMIDIAMPCRAIIKGDASEPAIAAASIVAKVTRDRLMARLSQAFPVYGFANHAGYGTEAHRSAILEHGPCPHHRYSFTPVKGRWLRT
ncbi:MAG: ribonuclease HII [Bosea sp. (in: a-proteobacteria)]